VPFKDWYKYLELILHATNPVYGHIRSTDTLMFLGLHLMPCNDMLAIFDCDLQDQLTHGCSHYDVV
jgi:hypothetical protein